MSELSNYSINLNDISPDNEVRRWTLDDAFFASLEQELINGGRIEVTLRVKKTTDAFKLQFQVDGEVTIPCDRCLDPMQQPIHGSDLLDVKLGDTFSDDGELITVPEAEGIIDLAWNIYEIVALHIPTSHVHPEGLCNTDMTRRLEQYAGTERPAMGCPQDPERKQQVKILYNNGTS